MVHSLSQRGHPPDQCPQQCCYLNMASASDIRSHEHWLEKRLNNWFVSIIEIHHRYTTCVLGYNKSPIADYKHQWMVMYIQNTDQETWWSIVDKIVDFWV